MTDDLRKLLATNNQGVLATIKRDGRPQLSVVGYAYYPDDDLLKISITDDRAKTRNLRRDPRVSFQVTPADGKGYAVAEGNGVLGDVAADPHDAAVEELVAHFRDVQGEHSDWDDFRAAMVRDKRVMLRLPVDYVYGWAPSAG